MTGVRVLQVSKSTGGVGQYMKWLVRSLDKRRFEVTAVCLSDDGDKLAAELSQVDGTRATSLQMERYKINLLSDVLTWWQLFKLIRREDFDLIHAHASKPGFLVRIAAALTRTPVLYSPHCFSFHSGVRKSKAWFYAQLERLAARLWTTRIIVLCQDEIELAKKFHVGFDGQFIIVYTGLNLSNFNGNIDRYAIRQFLGIPPDVFLFGTVGRLSRQKAPADFVQAAAIIHVKYPDAHFVWIGTGELQDETELLVRSLNLQDVFHFAGQRNDVPSVLHAIDCFVLTSHWEGFSLSVLEAMAARRPVVMSQVSGATEAVLNGETGLIVPIGDVKAIARALELVLSNPKKAEKMGQAGRHRVENFFTQTQMIADIQKIYEEIYALSLRKREKSHARKTI